MRPTELTMQAWTGKEPPTEKNLKPVRNREIPRHKPRSGGLWTSTYDEGTGGGWIDWCRLEDWSVPSDGWNLWLLSPDPDALIFTVHTYGDLVELVERFPHRASRCGCGPDDYLAPDWEAIAREFDAVHLTEEGQWATRLSMPLDLYGWDCESTLWFRWAFTAVEWLGRKVYSATEVPA